MSDKERGIGTSNGLRLEIATVISAIGYFCVFLFNAKLSDMFLNIIFFIWLIACTWLFAESVYYITTFSDWWIGLITLIFSMPGFIIGTIFIIALGGTGLKILKGEGN